MYFDWNNEKNIKLKKERNISFENIVYEIANWWLIDIMDHPNNIKYPNQKIFIIKHNSYIYIVPFIEDNWEIFLKTIIPSRKLTKKYL